MENSQKSCRKFKDVSLEELREKVAEFAKVRNWDQYHSPRNLLLALLADVCGLDLGQAALSKIVKNSQKYPLIK
ncbi:hypothetical protein Ccrd_022508 [Cynara cardunculus var. scolymus]|uniref:dCTP pyrophosphatase 1 n=1 Tax=Cynara cardunculus var. scolymus TaxID=59895 RepID=A0A103XYK8_CYNCS|nr:hypothetical protein Ccrd_022508 [Cynara cardunculus var. scolymus]